MRFRNKEVSMLNKRANLLNGLKSAAKITSSLNKSKGLGLIDAGKNHYNSALKVTDNYIKRKGLSGIGRDIKTFAKRNPGKTLATGVGTGYIGNNMIDQREG